MGSEEILWFEPQTSVGQAKKFFGCDGEFLYFFWEAPVGFWEASVVFTKYSLTLLWVYLQVLAT